MGCKTWNYKAMENGLAVCCRHFGHYQASGSGTLAIYLCVYLSLISFYFSVVGPKYTLCTL